MAKSISLAMKNEIGVDDAKRRIGDGFAQLKAQYIDKVAAADMTWEGDTAHVMVKAIGQEVTARIAVTVDEIKLDADLPWLLAGFSGMIESAIKERAGALGPAATSGKPSGLP